MITIHEQPLLLTPTNTEHVYSVSSTLSGNTDYRYVFDLYVDVDTTPTKIARLITAPNTYGYGTINVRDIIRNYVQGNARSDESQYTSETTTGTTAFGLLTNMKGLGNSNAFNTDAYYNEQNHVRTYRVMVGEQFTYLGSTVTYISNQPEIPASTFYAEAAGLNLQDINYYEAGSNIPNGSSLIPGITWNWTDSGAGFKDGGSITTTSGTIPWTGGTREIGDIVTIVESYCNIQYVFVYVDAYGPYETPHWELDYIEGPESIYDPCLSPEQVLIWPGTTLKEGSYTPYLTSQNYWGTTQPAGLQEYWEVLYYRMSGTTISEAEPSRFLTSAGDRLYNFTDAIAGNVTRARRRIHHPSCPILVSFFHGRLSENTDLPYINNADALYYLEGTNQSSSYTGFTEIALTLNATGLTSPSNSILYHNLIRPDLEGGKLAVWVGQSGEAGQWDTGGYSEFLEYYINDDDCLSDPVHLLFLNRQGVWDTWTVDRKSVETKNVKRSTYAQNAIANVKSFSLLSTNRRDIVYDQEITEQMTSNTWFLTDNERQVAMDLFQSPEVYIIKDHDWTGKLPETYNPYLLPVTLKTDTIQEFKNRYNKTIQYQFVLEYSPINQYFTQG